MLTTEIAFLAAGLVVEVTTERALTQMHITDLAQTLVCC